MPELTITLTDDDLRRLRSRASDERRTPENMALYIIAKALKPRRPVKRKPSPKVKARS